jgi:hypothetical protein
VAAILMLPSYGYDSRVWGRFVPLLAEQADVVPVDYPGHAGLPYKPNLIDTVETAEKAVAGLSGDLSAVASGDGAAGAVRLARQGHLRSMVLFSPAPLDIPPEVTEGQDLDALIAAELPNYDWAIEAMQMTDAVERRRLIAAHQVDALRTVVPEDDIPRLQAMFADNADLLLDPTARSTSGLAWLADLDDVTIPAVVVSTAGDGDPSIRVSEAVSRRLAMGQHLHLDASFGTVPWLTKPEETARFVLQALH